MRGFSRRVGFARIGGVVNVSLDELGFRHKVMEQQAVHNWAQVAGPQIAKCSIAEKVREGILFVVCKSSMWANELTLHKPDLVKRLNKSVGKAVITDIRFSARGFKRCAELQPKEQPNVKSKNLETIEVTEADTELAKRVASTAPSDELAKRIEKAILTSKRMDELKRQEGWHRCPKCNRLHASKMETCADCT